VFGLTVDYYDITLFIIITESFMCSETLRGAQRFCALIRMWSANLSSLLLGVRPEQRLPSCFPSSSTESYFDEQGL